MSAHRWSRVAAICLGLAFPALGARPPFTAGWQPRVALMGAGRSTCQHAKTQTAMTICEGRRLEAAEARLEGVLRGEEKHYDKALVKAAQEKWLAFRSSECMLEASLDKGGSIYPTSVEICELELTEARITQIKAVSARWDRG